MIPEKSDVGEQSVGKSFALNHLVDTSFAGSAMRTTGEQRPAVLSLSIDNPFKRGRLDVCHPDTRISHCGA